MGSSCTWAQVGSCMVSQCRNAFNRQSSKNCGSCFFLDMAATTSSSSPGGKLSDSMSVMKPCRYFCARRASTSWDLLDTKISSCRYASVVTKWGRFPGIHPGIHANFRRQVGDAQGRGVQTGQLAQRDLFQCPADGRVHPLPCCADSALALDAAMARRAAAFGDRDRSLEYVENLRGGNLFRSSRQTISALRTARGNHHAGALQTLEYLAHGGSGEARALGQFRRGAVPCGFLR